MKTQRKSLMPAGLKRASVAARKKLLGFLLRHLHRKDLVEVLNAHDLNVSRISDYYSPLPLVGNLAKHKDRWNKPSDLVGVPYDLDAMKSLLDRLLSSYHDEFTGFGDYGEIKSRGYGPGFPLIDSLVLYSMVRDVQPSRIVEIGSGLSTLYSSWAGEKNAGDGKPLEITCIDPFPRDALYAVSGVDIRKQEAQDASLEVFDRLQAGDMLFIDSTHVVKLDGEVPYLFLEVLPRLRAGVVIHIHDVHFPYNVPHPAEQYVFEWGRTRWPVFWNEAMLVQAFLCLNSAFRIRMSMPLLRHHSEDFLRKKVPSYQGVIQDDLGTHFGSLWIERTE